ncbi:MAG: NTP transferase domain-containing protein [Phycisphaerales bacterium]|nr:NTP transferase domain-containing protein [Phycisphaerales bacterium]
MTFGVAILVGGASRRMGTPKQHAKLPDGTSLGQRVMQLATGVSDLVVACGPAGALTGVEALPDLAVHAGLGPLAGIETVLMSNRADRWLVLPCDMPWLQQSQLASMRDYESEGCVMLEGCGPLPLRIDTSALGQVQEALEQRRLALKHLPCVRAAACLPVPDASTIRDADRPGDLMGRSSRPRP